MPATAHGNMFDPEQASLETKEIIHKMSKKIAQLTKVIFHLNTKNSDAEGHLRACRLENEREIEAVYGVCNAKVQQAWREVQKIEAAGGGRAEALERQLTLAKEDFSRREEDLDLQRERERERAEAELRSVTTEVKDRVDSWLGFEKEQAARRAREAREEQNVLVEKAANLAEELGDLKKRVVEEKERHERELREREKDLQERLAAEREAAAKEKSAALNDLEDRLRAEWKDERGRLMQGAGVKEEESAREVRELREKLSHLERTSAETEAALRAQLEQAERELADAGKELGGMAQAKAKADAECKRETERATAAQAERDRTARALREAEAQAKEAQARWDRERKQMERAVEAAKEETSRLRDSLELDSKRHRELLEAEEGKWLVEKEEVGS